MLYSIASTQLICFAIYTGRMSNTSKSVDVVKDCFGMTEVRENKCNRSASEESPSGEESSFDEEFHW